MLARTSTATPTGVLHVIDSLGLGGAQAILKDFFEYRTSSGAIFLYALRVVPGQLKIGHPNVSVNPSSWRFSMAPMLKLRAIVDSCAVDILHCHLFRAQVFGYLLKTIFFPRLVLVFHEHGRAVGREGESWIEAMLFRWFLAAAWRSVDAFVCNSDYTPSGSRWPRTQSVSIHANRGLRQGGQRVNAQGYPTVRSLSDLPGVS